MEDLTTPKQLQSYLLTDTNVQLTFKYFLAQREVTLLFPFVELINFDSFFLANKPLLQELTEEAPIDVFIFLLDHGLSVDIRLDGGSTPYLVACYCKKVDLMNLLFERGADPNIIDDVGRNAAFCAVSTDEVQILDRVILAGANLNVKTKEGRTLWYFAHEPSMFQRLAEMKVPIEEGLILKVIKDYSIYDIDCSSIRAKVAILRSVGCEEPTPDQLLNKSRRDYPINRVLANELLS